MSGVWSLTVTVPAADLQLLTEEELRAAAGLQIDDTSQDAKLATWGLQAAAALAGACGIAKAGYAAALAEAETPLRGEAPVTFKAETLVQTFRIRNGTETPKLLLARWPALAIHSVTVDMTELTTDDWELDIPGSAITRVSGNGTRCWPAGRVIVEYDAGFDDPIPADLKGYAARLVGMYHGSEGDDPNERRVEIPGVISIERWVDAGSDAIMPDDIMAGLQRDGYRRMLAW
jgi:hypothetical protein